MVLVADREAAGVGRDYILFAESTIDAAGRLSMIQLWWYSSRMIVLRAATSLLVKST